MSTQNSQDLFSSLLSDPSALSGLAGIISKMKPPPDTSAGNGSSDDLSGMLSAALSNPELLSMLPKLISTLSASSANTSAEPQRASEAQGSMRQSGVSPLGALPANPAFPAPARATDRRSALLLALKPYMSHDKAEMIDTIVKIIEILSLIK